MPSRQRADRLAQQRAARCSLDQSISVDSYAGVICHVWCLVEETSKVAMLGERHFQCTGPLLCRAYVQALVGTSKHLNTQCKHVNSIITEYVKSLLNSVL